MALNECSTGTASPEVMRLRSRWRMDGRASLTHPARGSLHQGHRPDLVLTRTRPPRPSAFLGGAPHAGSWQTCAGNSQDLPRLASSPKTTSEEQVSLVLSFSQPPGAATHNQRKCAGEDESLVHPSCPHPAFCACGEPAGWGCAGMQELSF